MKQTNTSSCKPSCFGNTGLSKSSRCEIEREFAERTSCHGINYWCNSVNEFQRILWILLVLGMTGGVVYQVYTRIDNYFEYDSSTSSSREFVNQIDFPAVTLCNYNRYFASHVSELLGFTFLNRITSPLFIAFANANNISVPTTAFTYLDNLENFTISSYLNQKGYQLEDGVTLNHCQFKSDLCTASDFTPVITRMGKCYTFNGDPSSHLFQSVAGYGQGLSLTLNVQHLNYTEEALYGNQEAGIMFQVHSKFEAPHVEKYGIGIPVGHKAFAVVNRMDSEIMYSPWGKCRPDIQKTLKYFSVYSINSCMQECYTDYLIDHCGCRTFEQYWAVNYASECTARQVLNCSTPYVSEIENTLTPESCQCTIPCSFTEYTTIPSYATSPSLQTRLHFENSLGFLSADQIIQNNFVALEVTFSEIGYSKETQTKKVDEGSLVSDVGGQLGLWIGMSFLTMAEFIQYFAVRLYTSCKALYKKVKNNGKITQVEDANVPSSWKTKLDDVEMY